MANIELRPWPVRPRPYADESLQGYLLRIAHYYNWQSVYTLCKDLTGRRPTPQQLKGSRLYDEASMALAEVMQIPRDNLHAHWDKLLDAHHCYDPGRVIASVEIGTPRVCPGCVAEHGYFRFAWQVGHVLICPVHHCWLQDTCSCCDTAFNWRSDLLNGCPTCYSPWSALAAQTLQCGIVWPTPTRDELKRVYQAFLSFALPGSVEVWQHQCLAYDVHRHSALMAGAYKTVYSKNGNDSLLKAALDRHDGSGPLVEITRRHVTSQIQALKVSNKLSDVVAEHPSLHGNDDIALPKRIRRARAGHDPAMMAPIKLCAALLGAELHTLNALVKAGLIPEAGRTAPHLTRLFNLDAVSDSLAQWLNRAVDRLDDEGASFDEAAALLQTFGLDDWHVIAWCADSRLPFTYTHAEALVDGLQVSRPVLLRLAELEIREIDGFTLAQVLRMLRISQAELKALSQAQCLRPARGQAQGTFFERDEVLHFLSNFRIARREAFISNTMVQTAWQNILNEGWICVIEWANNGRLLGLARHPDRQVSAIPEGH